MGEGPEDEDGAGGIADPDEAVDGRSEGDAQVLEGAVDPHGGPEEASRRGVRQHRQQEGGEGREAHREEDQAQRELQR